MTDIATLGISINSRDAVTAKKALDDLTASAKPAANAAADVGKQAGAAASGVSAIATSTNGASTALRTLNSDLRNLSGTSSTALSSLSAMQKQVNALTGVKAPSSDFSALLQQGQYLDDLRSKYNPLFAAQRQYEQQVIDINSAARQGALSEKEKSEALTRTRGEYDKQVASIKNYSAANSSASNASGKLTQQTGLARYELINLSRQFQDVGVSLASGQSPLLVAVQQGTQIADVFASSGGTVGGFVKQVATGFMSLLTPARVLVGGLAAVGVAAVSSVVSWQGAQRDINIALMGIGRASQATAGDINRIATATSSFNGLSTTQARETASTLAATGKIGVENIQLLTANTKNFAAALGLDVPKAAEAMAKIFANPTEGAKQLAQSIGGIDSVTLKYIETLEAQGNRQQAIKVLADAVIPSIAKASEQTGILARGWNGLTNLVSNGYNAIGKAISQIGTNGLGQQSEDALEKQRKSLEQLIQDWQTAGKPQFDINAAMQQLAAVNDALMEIERNKKTALGVDAAQTTLQVSPIVSALAPAPDLIRQVNASLTLMTQVMNDPAFEQFRSKIGDQLPLAFARLQAQANAFKINPRLADPIQSQIDSLNTQNKLLADQSPAMRQRVAYQLAYNDAIKQGASAQEAAQLASARGKQAYGGVATDIQQQQALIALYGQTATAADAAKQVDLQVQAAHLQDINIDKDRVAILRQLAVEQSLGITAIKASADAQRVEAASVGMSVGDATAYAAAQNAINDARRAGRALTPDNIAQIQREASALGQAAAQADLLKFAYTGLVQGPIQAFTSAIANGSSAWDAFKKAGQSALNAIASKLADMAAQNLWKAALGGSSGGIGGILGSLFGGGSGGGLAPVGVVGAAGGMAVPTFGFDGGGYTGPGGKYQPAGVVHKGEYVIDAANTARIGVHNLDRLRGYAEGGIVDGLSGFNVRGSAANDNSSAGSGGQRVHVTVGVSVDRNGNLQAYVKDVSQSTATAALDGFVTSPQFPEHVALANKRVGSRMLG